jgi:hypothetical protein
MALPRERRIEVRNNEKNYYLADSGLFATSPGHQVNSAEVLKSVWRGSQHRLQPGFILRKRFQLEVLGAPALAEVNRPTQSVSVQVKGIKNHAASGVLFITKDFLASFGKTLVFERVRSGPGRQLLLKAQGAGFAYPSSWQTR